MSENNEIQNDQHNSNNFIFRLWSRKFTGVLIVIVIPVIFFTCVSLLIQIFSRKQEAFKISEHFLLISIAVIFIFFMIGLSIAIFVNKNFNKNNTTDCIGKIIDSFLQAIQYFDT
jgi:quinol-cytochrome oxidoreductase complex cytochrome b subunit